MNTKNNGTIIEKNIITYINKNKYINNMNENMKNFLCYIFNFNLANHQIKAYKYAEKYKPDIIVTANGISKYISIKSGNNNSVHQEHFYSFLFFLSELQIKKELITELRLFQFNDGTLNGTGQNRRTAIEFLEKNQEKIQEINNFLNNSQTIEIIIDRLLFKGEYPNVSKADYIYYGNIQNGLWASRNEIIYYLLNEKNYSSSIHVSKLYYQSLHRNLKYDKFYEYRRHYIQFKWYSIKQDLEFITKKRK